jgi:large subunit ribosomal protein L24
VSRDRSVVKKFKIKKGDRVVVVTGRDRGKQGEVLRVVRKEDRLIVQGVNMVKRHSRPSAGHPGGIIDKEAPIHISNVAHVDPSTNRPTRVGYKLLDDGRKVRVARRSGEVLDH